MICVSDVFAAVPLQVGLSALGWQSPPWIKSRLHCTFLRIAFVTGMDTSAQYVLFYDFEAGALFVSLMSGVVSVRAFTCMYMYAMAMNVETLFWCMELKRAAVVFPSSRRSALGRATQSEEIGIQTRETLFVASLIAIATSC